MRIFTQRLILCFYAISLHVIGVYVQGDWLVCGGCKCKWNSGKKTGDCRNISLETVPDYLHSELQVLDLSFNRISTIEEDAFLKSSLQNLHKLFVRNCSLQFIFPNGLRGLEILIELDLSNNLMKTLSPDVFVSLVKLRSLILNNNVIEMLENGLFRNLEYLKKVELKENRIVAIGTDVFVNVPLLSQIFLSGNKLSFLRKETFTRLTHLQSLSLELNPWNCTCELQDFREFVLRRNLYTPPTSCHEPSKLRGMLWNDNQTIPFACKPRIIYPPRGTSINTSKENVTLTCRVYTSPSTLINWEYNKQIYLGNYQRVHIQSIRDEKRFNASDREFGRELVTSRLTIVGAEKSDEGHYACVAFNSAGRDEVEMRLLVEKHSHQNILIQNNLIIVICLMVLGLLSASIFLAMITCCVYKKFRAINHRAAEEQQLQQKRNFGGLNVLNAVNEPYHHAGTNSDANYIEIKATKLQSEHVGNGDLVHVGGGGGGVVTSLDASRDLYHENGVQGSVSHQSTKFDAEATHHHPNHNQQHLKRVVMDSSTSDYQPDLLPYIPQSIPLNSLSVNNDPTAMTAASVVNSSNSCNNQPPPTSFYHYQPHQHPSPPQHPSYTEQRYQQQQINGLADSQHYRAQKIVQQLQHSRNDEDEISDNDLECANNFLMSKKTVGQPGQSASYGMSDTPNNNWTCISPTNNTMAINRTTGQYEGGFDYNTISKRSIVRASPSLNFLSNHHHPRQELL